MKDLARNQSRPYLTVPELAIEIGVGTSSAYKMLRSKEIPSIRTGQSGRHSRGRFIVPKMLFAEWMKRRVERALAECEAVLSRNGGAY